MNSSRIPGNTQMNSLSISVVIPAYNEEKNIEDVLLRTKATMKALQFPHEIIVVDDGSTDKTRSLAAKHKVTIVKNGRNQGKGRALRMGFEKATGDILVTMDADGSHRPEEIKKLIVPLLNGADFVMGSRFIGKRKKDAVKRLHILGNHLFNVMIFILTKRRITDSQTGFRAFTKKVCKELKITSKGYTVETELTVKALKNGYSVQEEQITCEKRREGCSHLNPLVDGFKILKTIIKSALTI